MSRQAIDAKVAAVVSETEVVLNRGSSDGVTEGADVELFDDFDVVDPDSHEPLGSVSVVKLTLQVTNVQERLCVAKTATTGETLVGIFSSRPKIWTKSSSNVTPSSGKAVEIGERAQIYISDK